MQNIGQIKNIIYNLKRKFPTSLELHKKYSYGVDRETGKKSSKTRILKIRRAPILPAKQIPDFIYDLSYIASNKNFTYGGFFGTETRTIIIDGKDIPLDFELDLNVKVIINQKSYEIKNINPTVGGRSYILTVTFLSSVEKVDG
jgi:hypothetical protein